MEGGGSLNSRWTCDVSVRILRLTEQHTWDERQEVSGTVLATWGSLSMGKMRR